MLLLDASVPYTDEPPDTRVTWREFFANEEGVLDDEAIRAGWEVDPDDFADEWSLQSQWDRRTGPAALAYRRLKPFEDQLGPVAVGDDDGLGYDATRTAPSTRGAMSAIG